MRYWFCLRNEEGTKTMGMVVTTKKVIRTKIRTAKNEWLKQQCEELEQLQRIHDDFNLHGEIKETARVYRKSPFSNAENDQEELAQDDQ